MDKLDRIFSALMCFCLGATALLSLCCCCVLAAALTASPCAGYPPEERINMTFTKYGTCIFPPWVKKPLCPLGEGIAQQLDGGIYFLNKVLTRCAAPALITAVIAAVFAILSVQFLRAASGRCESWRNPDYVLLSCVITVLMTFGLVLTGSILSTGVATICNGLEKPLCTKPQNQQTLDQSCLRLRPFTTTIPNCESLGVGSALRLYGVASSIAWVSVAISIISCIASGLDVCVNEGISWNSYTKLKIPKRNLPPRAQRIKSPKHESSSENRPASSADPIQWPTSASVGSRYSGGAGAGARYAQHVPQAYKPPAGHLQPQSQQPQSQQPQPQQPQQPQRLSNMYQTGGISPTRLAYYTYDPPGVSSSRV